MPVKGSKWGTPHQKRREREIRKFRPGLTTCARCGRPMEALYRVTAAGKRVAAVQLGHPDAGNGMRYALEHDTCNESAGGQIGTERQGKTSRTKTCPICHVSYRASRADQIACSREHADAVRRGDKPWPLAGRAW